MTPSLGILGVVIMLIRYQDYGDNRPKYPSDIHILIAILTQSPAPTTPKKQSSLPIHPHTTPISVIYESA